MVDEQSELAPPAQRWEKSVVATALLGVAALILTILAIVWSSALVGSLAAVLVVSFVIYFTITYRARRTRKIPTA